MHLLEQRTLTAHLAYFKSFEFGPLKSVESGTGAVASDGE